MCFFLFRNGNPYIYEVLNWEMPIKAIVMVIGASFLATIVETILFFIYKLRVHIKRQLINADI